MTERKATLLVGLYLLALMLLRILLVPLIELPLFFDEAHYLHWSLEPDWGYFSKPPMVAVFIWLSTHLFGFNEWAVKLSSPLLYTATAGLIWRMGHEWFSPRAGRWAALLFASMPLVGFNSLFVTTDAPLLFFWALTAWLFARALQVPEQWSRWLLAGLAGGLGLLSKYSMILLPASLFIWLILYAEHRRQLLKPGFWLAVAAAFVLFLPNLYWNWQNDFISFQHTAEISQLDRQWFHPQHLAEFVLGQAFIVGPLTAWMGWQVWRSRHAWPETARQWLSLSGWLAWPTWILLAILALLSRANLNWAAPATIGFALLAGGGWALLQKPARWVAFTIVFNLSLLGLFYSWPQILQALHLPQKAGYDPYHRIRGWKSLGEQAQELLQQHPGYTLTADNRKVLALLGYYAQPGSRSYAYYNTEGQVRNQYAISHDLYRLHQQQGLNRFLLFSRENYPETLMLQFDRVQPLGSIVSRPYNDLERRLYVYALEGPREPKP